MSPDAGWYDDPQDATQYRYWDGTTWTEHRSPRGGAASQSGGFTAGASRPSSGSSRIWIPILTGFLGLIIGGIVGGLVVAAVQIDEVVQAQGDALFDDEVFGDTGDGGSDGGGLFDSSIPLDFSSPDQQLDGLRLTNIVTDCDFADDFQTRATVDTDGGVTSATVRATYYDAAGDVLGSDTGVVDGLEPGNPQQLEIITFDDCSMDLDRVELTLE